MNPLASSRSGRVWPVCFILLMAIATSWSSITNPGYFSHDELGYVGNAWPSPWSPHKGMVGFVRPLGALAIWALVNLSPTPQLAHAVAVLAHLINVLLLRRNLQRAGSAYADWGTALFAVSPLAAYSIGWTAAIFDMGWVGCGLAMWLLLQQQAQRPGKALIAGLTTLYIAALLFKESALVLPLLLVGAAVFQKPALARQHWMRPAASLALVSLAYVAMRFAGLQSLAAGGTGGYGLAAPAQWLLNALVYWVFPLSYKHTEVQQILVGSAFAGIAAIAIGHLVMAYWLAGRSVRGLAGYALFYFLPLLPVLIISKHETQYLYGSAATSAAFLALAGPAQGKKWLMTILVIFFGLHAAHIHRFFYRDGKCQATFIASMHEQDWTREKGPVVTFSVSHPDTRWWVIQRALVQLHPGDSPILEGKLIQKPGEANYLVNEQCRITQADQRSANRRLMYWPISWLATSEM